jgi:S-methylmethionine-dependent homocysteine/selenocysteine methylase
MEAASSPGAGRETTAGWLERRLAQGPALLLDGALGTELERRGVACGLPLWSTHALLDRPELVAEVHRDYVEAGAEIVTANTFRTQRRTLARAAGLAERDAELSARAIELARQAARGAPRPVIVAGSAAPLEDCFAPELVPDAASLNREHTRHAENLAGGGADLILIETMNCIREAEAAARAARATGLPFHVSFVCWREGRLLSGESLADALRAVLAFGPLSVGVNCLPPSAVAACLSPLCNATLPFGVYANLGAPAVSAEGERSEDCTPEVFSEHADSWLRAGARLVGGCCGTGPAHIRALARLLARV